ncbi:MAG TPA: YhdP family protein [Rhodanobacteraceae bacterium]|nr:YhdP family protein [Rhodanobacteraceae bacterium]
MTNAWRHHLRRARFAVMALVAVVLIAAAVAMGLVQLLLPLATHYPNFLARQLSERLHRPVEFASVSSQWQPSGPLLQVRDLTLGPAQPGGASITLPHAALKFDFGAWLHPAHRWITLRLNDMKLRVEHTTSGWEVAGFSNTPGGSHASLQSLPIDLDLRNLHVDIVDEVGHHAWQLFAPRLRVVNIGQAVRFGGRIRQFGTRQAVAISGRVRAATRDYDLYVSTSDLDLAKAARGVDLHGYSVAGGHADLELWGSWRGGKLRSASFRYGLRGVAASGPGGRSLDLPALSGFVRAKRARDGWQLAWRGPGKPGADIDAAGGILVQLRGGPGAWHVSAAGRAIDLSPWLGLLAMAPQAPQALVDWVANAQPHVEIDTAALAWNQGGRYSATIRFSDLHAAASGAIPGLGLAGGTIRADNEAMSLELPAQPAMLAVTDVFRKPFSFTRFGGTVIAWRGEGNWNVAIDSLQFLDSEGLAGGGRAHLVWDGNGHAPFLSAYAVLEHATVPDAKRFLPYHNMPHSLVAWMDHALVGGDVTSGRVLMRGHLDDWPFPSHRGRFEAAATISDAAFDFSDQWPRATEVDAAVDFIDNHMGVVATHARVRGVTATHAVATIPDLGHGALDLDVQGGGGGAQLLDFVRHTPVAVDAADALRGLTINGAAKFRIRLAIPLDHVQDFTLDGKVDLAHADVTAKKWKVALEDLGGEMLIDQKGFRAPALTGKFRGAPAILSMAVGGAVSDPADIVEASLDTRASAQALVQGYPEIVPLVAHVSGAAPFHIGVRLVRGAKGAPATPILNVQSSLVGLALDFPAPLDKPAATALPLNLTLQLPPDGAPLSVSLGDTLQVRGRLADPARNRPAALAMHFGASLPQQVPAKGLVVDGHAKLLDVSGWIQQALGSGPGAAFPQLVRANVSTDDARVFGTDLGALQFDYEAGTEQNTIRFDGTAVKGVVALPNTELMARGITARFDYLHWPQPPKPKQPEQPPLPPQPPQVTSPIAPTAIPPLHVALGDLRLGDMNLGATTFESMPNAAGMHVASFDSKHDGFTIHATGDWNGTMAYSQSHFVVDIAAQDFGKTLAAFGFSGLLAGGKDTHIHIEGAWPGGPSSFSLAWMTGKLAIKMGDGRILAVKPGLGRVLGLLSVRELPSRLMLHFGDVFKSGFGFDDASATFTVKGGSAYTDDMLIDAPAARITMHGRAGFRTRDYDLTIGVIPHLGGALPVVGAVIGGPVGAAAGLVVQGLVGKGINRAAGSVYRVTGTWDKPKIVTVKGAEPVPAASAAAASTAPSEPPPSATSAAGVTTSGALPAPLPAASTPAPSSIPAASSSAG